MGSLFLLIALIAGLLVYFLPTIIADNRKHPNTTAIGVFNFFLGWTFLGWVLALVWSLGNTKPKETIVVNSPENETVKETEDNLDQLLKLKKLLDEGVISQEEFDLKKQKLLNS